MSEKGMARQYDKMPPAFILSVSDAVTHSSIFRFEIFTRYIARTVASKDREAIWLKEASSKSVLFADSAIIFVVLDLKSVTIKGRRI